MSPRPNVSDERKHQILNAAEKVLSQKGFNDTRMDDIADETGVSKGTIYLYFKSKDDLIIAILDRLFQRELRELVKIKPEQSATESIWQFINMASGDIAAMLRLMPIAYEFLALAFRNKYVQLALKQYFGRFIDILLPIIQQGIDRGEFRQVNASEVALAIGAIIEGTILLWAYDSSRVDPIRHIHSSIKLLLEGIQTPLPEALSNNGIS